jgi:hypothetical protein
MEESNRKPDYSINQLVLYILAIITLAEFVLGAISTTNIAGFMLAIGLFKAYFIVRHYMNFGRLFSGDGEEHS